VTPTQRKDRRLDIEGELKQARNLVAECVAEEARVTGLLETARKATATQRGNLDRLEDECRQLAEEARNDFLSLIDHEVALLETPEEAAAIDAAVLATPDAIIDNGDGTVTRYYRPDGFWEDEVRSGKANDGVDPEHHLKPMSPLPSNGQLPQF
jgi:hypothetical protein